MKDSFTIDELRSFLEETKNRNHLEFYYRTLTEEEHQVDMEQFYTGMDYFLQDLQHHLDEINRPELDRIKAICSYKTPIEALNNLYKHINKNLLRSLTVCKFPDNGDGVLYDYYGTILPLNDITGTEFDKQYPDSDWTHSESYHAHYDEENNALVLFVNIGGYSKLSNK